MNQSPTDSSLTSPQFIREREAWYKAGAAAMAGYSAICIFVVGAVAGGVSIFIDIAPSKMATVIVIAAWICIAAINAYINVTARNTANEGGVEVDRF